MAREVNEAGKRLIKAHEGCKLIGYLCPAGIPTWGYGHTGPEVKVGQQITFARAEQDFDHDLAAFASHVDELLAGAPTTDNQFAAMVSLAYNIGIGRVGNAQHAASGFISSDVLHFHRLRIYDKAAKAFGNWTRGGGRVLPGLVSRRHDEAELYLTRP